MNQTTKRSPNALLGVFVVLALVLVLLLFSKEEVSHFNNPLGRYTVVVSKRRYQSFLMRAPGDSSGAPGFVEIFDRGGKSFGRVPVDMIQFADNLKWTEAMLAMYAKCAKDKKAVIEAIDAYNAKVVDANTKPLEKEKK